MLFKRKTYLIAMGLAAAPLTMATFITDNSPAKAPTPVAFPGSSTPASLVSLVSTINAGLAKGDTAFVHGNATAIPTISTLQSATSAYAAAQQSQIQAAQAAQYQGAAPLVAPSIAFPTASQYADFNAKIVSDWSAAKIVAPSPGSFYSMPTYQFYAQPAPIVGPAMFVR